MTHLRNPELADADALCARLARRHQAGLILASWWLPQDLRGDLDRIHAFCQVIDDLCEEPGTDAARRLAAWYGQVEAMLTGVPPVHPVLLALRRTMERHTLAGQPFLDLIAAAVRDQRVAGYDSAAQLEAHCRGVTVPAGRMVLTVLGIHEPAAKLLADDVWAGLRLAHYASDALPGRPGARHLLRPEVATAGLAAAIEANSERAALLLASGEDLEHMLAGSRRLHLRVCRLRGLALLRTARSGGSAPGLALRSALAARALAQGVIEDRRGRSRSPVSAE